MSEQPTSAAAAWGYQLTGLDWIDFTVTLAMYSASGDVTAWWYWSMWSVYYEQLTLVNV